MQVVLLFGTETWVLLAAINRKLEVVHVGFLWKLTGKTASQQWVGIWSRAAAGIFLKKRGPRHLVRT